MNRSENNIFHFVKGIKKNNFLLIVNYYNPIYDAYMEEHSIIQKLPYQYFQ